MFSCGAADDMDSFRCVQGAFEMRSHGSVRGALEERCGSVAGTAEKHVWEVVVPITWGVTEACGKRCGRRGTFQGRFRSVSWACEEMVESFGGVRGAPESDMKR